MTLKLSKCKQSGPYELLSSCRLPAPSNHIRAAFSLSGSECKRCAKECKKSKNIYEYILNFFLKMIIFITTKFVFDDFFSNSQLFTFTITSDSLSSTRLYMRSVIIRYLFNVHSFGAPASTSFISSYFSLNDNCRLFVFSDIVLTFKLAYRKHLRSRWHCHRTKVQIQWAVDIATAN